MTFLEGLSSALSAAFSQHVAVPASPSVRPPQQGGFDVQCGDAMALAAKAGLPPRALAEAAATSLSSSGLFDEVVVTGPGFLNMKLSPAFLAASADEMLRSPRLGIPDVGGNVVTVIDFGGCNIAKPLHVGHLRSFVIGESLRRILAATGHAVVSDIHLGDWGLQMGMLLMEARRRWPAMAQDGAFPQDVTVETLEAMYRDAALSCKRDDAALNEARRLTLALQSGDPAAKAAWERIRELSLAVAREDIAVLGAHFDLFLGESDANDVLGPMVEGLLASGHARESEGAVVIGGGEGEPPLILRKSDGAALYGSTDLAALLDRTGAMGARKVVYVVDRRQSQHLNSVFAAARAAGFDNGAELVHAAFGTVNGNDGKPFKTRDGGAARLSDLVNDAVARARKRLAAVDMHQSEAEAAARQVGVGAIKFADLSTDRLTGYVFDADRMVSFEGRTGPYLQYACVRIRAVTRKARENGLFPSDAIQIRHPAERALAVECLRFPDSVRDAAARLQPREVAERAFLVAQAFSRFYTECPVLRAGSEEAAPRLALCALAEAVLERCLFLLGIEIPDRM